MKIGKQIQYFRLMLLDFIALSVGIAVTIKCVQSIVKKGKVLERDQDMLYKKHRYFEIFNKQHKHLKDNKCCI